MKQPFYHVIIASTTRKTSACLLSDDKILLR